MAGLVSVVVSRDRDGAERHEHDGERVRRVPFKRVERREHASVGAHETPAHRSGGGRPPRRPVHERALHGSGQGGSRQAVLDGGPPPKGGDRDHGSTPPPRPAGRRGPAAPPRREGPQRTEVQAPPAHRRDGGGVRARARRDARHALARWLDAAAGGLAPAVAAETATPQPLPKLTATPPKQLRKPHRRKPRKHRAPVRTTTPPGEIMAITVPTPRRADADVDASLRADAGPDASLRAAGPHAGAAQGHPGAGRLVRHRRREAQADAGLRLVRQLRVLGGVRRAEHVVPERLEQLDLAIPDRDLAHAFAGGGTEAGA